MQDGCAFVLKINRQGLFVDLVKNTNKDFYNENTYRKENGCKYHIVCDKYAGSARLVEEKDILIGTTLILSSYQEIVYPILTLCMINTLVYTNNIAYHLIYTSKQSS